MVDVIRWGRTAYETDDSLALEREYAEDLGLSWALHPSVRDAPDLAGVRALVIPSKVRIDEAVLGGFAGSLVLTTTSGYDHVDVEAAKRRGVVVARCPMARRDPVVEHALASAMFLMRRTDALMRASMRGQWARGDLPALGGRGMAGARVLLVGLGVIGSRLAEVLTMLGAEVLGVDPRGLPEGVTPAALPSDLRRVDLISLHCALTASSSGWLDAEKLALLSPHTVVVNTARGRVMDVAEAVECVRRGELRGVACDVFPEEPYPKLAQAAEVPGVLLSPHAAGYVHDLGERVAREVGETLRAWVAGDPLPGAVP